MNDYEAKILHERVCATGLPIRILGPAWWKGVPGRIVYAIDDDLYFVATRGWRHFAASPPDGSVVIGMMWAAVVKHADVWFDYRNPKSHGALLDAVRRASGDDLADIVYQPYGHAAVWGLGGIPWSVEFPSRLGACSGGFHPTQAEALVAALEVFKRKTGDA